MRTIERNGESKLKQKLSTRPAEIMALEWMLSVNVKEYKQIGLDLSNQIFQRSNDATILKTVFENYFFRK